MEIDHSYYTYTNNIIDYMIYGVIIYHPYYIYKQYNRLYEI